MKAAVFDRPGKLMEIKDVADPEPGEGEVIVKVARCGVCGTDLHFTSGHGYAFPSGTTLGHEYAGEIVELGKGVSSLKLGDHIAGMPVVGCGHCENCKTGVDVLCTTYSAYAEGAAQFAKVSTRGAILLPQTVSLADGALVEPLAVGRRGVRLAAPTPDTKALVIGPGPIGLASIFWLWQAGVRNIAVLASSSRRRALAEKMGAEHYILEDDHAAEQVIQALGGAPDLVIEAAGVPGVLGRAVELIRPQGLIIGLGLCATPETFASGMALMKDITLRFSTTYTRDDFHASADALASDNDRATAMITDQVSLADFPQAFEDFRNSKIVGKLVVDPWA